VTDNIIQIKRSANTTTPPDGTLEWGELAYSFASNALFIGTDANTSIEIGGAKYVGYLDHTSGVLTANSAILVDANNHINIFNTGAFRISASGVTTDWITSIVNQITGSGSNNEIVSSYGIKTYVDAQVAAGHDSANVNILGGSITNAVISGGTINNLDAPIDVDDGGTGVTSFTQNSVAYVNSNTSILSFLTGTNGSILQMVNSEPAFGGIDGGLY